MSRADPRLFGLDHLCSALSACALSSEERALLLTEAEKLVGILRGKRGEDEDDEPAVGLMALNDHELQAIAIATAMDDLESVGNGWGPSVGTRDLMCIALTCRRLRDVVFAICPPRYGGHGGWQLSPRVLTVIQMGSASVARLELAIELGLLDCGDPIDLTDLCVEAAAFGRRKVLERAVAEGVRCSTYDFDEARVPLVRSTKVLRGAAYGGQLGTMQWLASCGSRPDGGVMEAAARARSREAVIWLREQGCEWDEMDHAGAVEVGSAINGSLEGYCFYGPWSGRERPADLSFVRWLRELGAPWSSHTLSRLIECAHVDMRDLHWAVADDCPLSDGAGLSAATAGRVDILSWLDALDALPRSKKLTQAAASGGHLEALAWLRSNGCRWGGATVREAASRDHVHVVEWAVANGCPWCPTVVADAAVSARNYVSDSTFTGAPRVVAWLRQHGHSQVDWSEAQWEPHRKRKQMMYDVYYQTCNYTNDSADDDDDVSSVDWVDATTPRAGDDYEQFGYDTV